MNDIYDVIFEAIEQARFDGMNYVDPEKFEQALEDMGYMIVPVEDPTNLFGIQEDSL